MSQQISIANLNNGGVIEAIDVALLKIAENIADINTPPAKPRKLTLELVFTPDKARNFAIAKATVKTSLQPEEPQEISLHLDEADGVPVLLEAYAGTNPNQHILPGTSPADVRKDNTVNNITPFRTAAQG